MAASLPWLISLYFIIGIVLIFSSDQFFTYADNIALGKPTKQLGRWKIYGSERAVDGNTDQNLDHGSCAHPDGQDRRIEQSLRGNSSWWSVDLAAGDASKGFVIKDVTIYFRTSCCDVGETGIFPERIRGVLILVGNTSDSHKECARTTTGDNIQTLPCDPSTPVRFLTVRHPTNPSLALCEVIVNGFENVVNIAKGKPTQQLGQWKIYGSERAVDGNTDQNLDHGSCAHPDGQDRRIEQSLRGNSSWWSVDLAAGDASIGFVIEDVTLVFRAACCDVGETAIYPERKRGVLILVGNTSDIGFHTECAKTTKAENIQRLLCRPSTPIRFLTVKHPTNPSLGLCEVIVNGYENVVTNQSVPPVSILLLSGVIAGGVAVLVIIAVIIGCVCLRKSRKRRKRRKKVKGPPVVPSRRVNTKTNAYELPDVTNRFHVQRDGNGKPKRPPAIIPTVTGNVPAVRARAAIKPPEMPLEENYYTEVIGQGPALGASVQYDKLTDAKFNQWMVENKIDNNTKEKLRRHGISTVEDITNLSHPDMIEIGLNVGERNRLKNAIAII